MYHEYLEIVLFPDPSTQQKFRESYIEKYRNRKPDLIIAVGLSAIRFISEAHERFFPDTPVVFCGGIEEYGGDLKLDSQFTGAWLVPQPAKTFEAALQLQPGTKHVFVVGGAGKMDRFTMAMVKERLRPYESRVEFTFLTDLTMPALIERLKRLPDKTIVFYTSFSEDAAGARFIDAKQSIPMVTAAANAPVYVLADTFVGQGTVGGYVSSYAAQGQTAAAIAVKILNGARPTDIPIVRGTNVYMFDWRALHRWGIRESDLPGGSTVLYRVPNAWELYRWQIEAALFFVTGLIVLIGYLLFEHSRRKRAEESLMRQLRFETVISEISADFMNLSSTEIESGIQKSLVKLREFLGVARVSIFEFTDKNTNLTLRHSARAQGAATGLEVLRKADFPWLFGQLGATEPLVISRLDEVPSEAKGERELFREMNAGKIVIFPLKVEGCMVGILSFVVIQPATSWPKDLMAQLEAVSQVSANAFARELAQKALFESEARFRTMSDAAPAFVWMSDQDGKYTYLNKKTLEFTGAQAHELNGDGWCAFLHPEDLSGALEANAQALQKRERFLREYRVRRSDGVYRWMFDIGNPRFDAEGLFVGFIGSAVDVTDQRLAREALERVGGQLIAAQEKERSHLARELHDDICQRLAMLSLRIGKITKGWGNGQMPVSDQLEQIRQQCADLAGDVQALSHELHPSLLDNVGLVAAVKSFCREFSEQNDALVEFSHTNVPASLPREISLSIFRVVQEALHNAAKYSGVSEYEVNLRGEAGEIELEVSDQGVGFDLATKNNAQGLGLVSMRERMILLNGTIRIESNPNAGTRIRASVPLVTELSALSAHAASSVKRE
jgi:PAS domain S-box-containing protein